ncbi:MAG: BMP family ABC transporter substrate-binding protein [Ruminococcaceae bacterium]|nr:BMP family ABC transporter substrate-binding protein [Oscillospiraceae bacterium]
MIVMDKYHNKEDCFMDLLHAQEEYTQALRLGQKEYKALTAAGKDPYPQVLDALLEGRSGDSVVELGVIEVPTEQIVGTKEAGRTSAFSASFLPLLGTDTEFAAKWINLCKAHLTEGIRDPILCYEFLGKLYVQEGNKRVSVLKHMGAPRIPSIVKRILPVQDGSPRVLAYYEFLDFYRNTGIYAIQFRQPGDYAKLLSHLGKSPEDGWTEQEKRTFSAYYQYFRDAFDSLDSTGLQLLPEEALLLWLQVYPYQDLGRLPARELKKTLSALWDDLVSFSQPETAMVSTEPETKGGLLSWITAPSHIRVAFVHPLDPVSSTWIKAHDEGRQHLQNALGEQVSVESYFHADTPPLAEQLLEQAVADGAEVIFATTPQLRRSVLRVAVKYPKVRFFNCSVDTHYSSVPSYYGRIFEAKFITGALAGAMAQNDRIGYIASSPTFGVPASINAFALGAQMTNPRAKILLRWSCQRGAHQQDFLQEGIHVISNRDAPTENPAYLNFGNYGTYGMDEWGQWEAIGSPVWLWGKFYENIISSMLSGTWDREENSKKAVDYWWGMDSGVIDVHLSDRLPTGLKVLANCLRTGLKEGTLDPFCRRIVDQQGVLRNAGDAGFTPDELLHMDWLCDNVIGHIPEFEEVEAYAQPMLRELGIHRDRIPLEKEGPL